MSCTSVRAVEVGWCFVRVSVELVEMSRVSVSPHPCEQSQLAVYRTGSAVAWLLLRRRTENQQQQLLL